MILSIFSKNSFFTVLAAPSSSFISASLICLSIIILYHIFYLLATVRCCLMNLRLSDLILNKKYSEEQALVFMRYDNMGRNSKYISGLLTSKKSKKEQREVFNLFSMLLMGVSGIVENGNTNSLFYTVLNNVLLGYFEVISMWDKKGVPNDCWDYLKMVNIKMHEYD